MHPGQTLKVAAAYYPTQRVNSWDAGRAKREEWISAAAIKGAKVLVFPEYCGMEFVGIADRRTLATRRSPSRHTLGPLPITTPDRRRDASLQWEIDCLQPLIEDYVDLHASLARKHRIYVLAGTMPVRQPDGSLRNTAYLCAPDGSVGTQDKIVPTRWEHEVWGVVGADTVNVFQTEFGRVGIAICYDVEFPVICRRQAEARARIVLTPCCTDSLRGFYRVQIGARARALENQLYVVHSTAGTGFGAIYAPPDLGPCETGVVAQGELNDARLIFAELDLAAIERIRGTEPVGNSEDWARHSQLGPALNGTFADRTAGSASQHRNHFEDIKAQLQKLAVRA